MESSKGDFSFKRLLATLPRGEPLDVGYLKERGLSTVHAAHLAKAEWLTHLGRGVYMVPGDTLTRDGCLAFLMRHHEGLHVGGKTALAWRGFRHNISFRDTITLWGVKQIRLPAWFTTRFEATYQTTKLFDSGMKPNVGVQPLPSGSPAVMVSAPERAVLEFLSDVGKTELFQGAVSLLESTHKMRPEVLETLLAHTTRTKVLRLARSLSEQLDLPWAPLARKYSEQRGGGARWIAVSRNGERLDLKP